MFSQKLVPLKRSKEQRLRKKMTNGIVWLTRPRFGKRSTRPIPTDVERYISAYLANNVGMLEVPKRSKNKSSAKDFSNLTRPRYGKRSLHGPSHVLKFLLAQDGKSKIVPENEEQSDNKTEEDETVR